jgi:hypothetical protein
MADMNRVLAYLRDSVGPMQCGQPFRSPMGLRNELEALEAFKALLNAQLARLLQNPLATTTKSVKAVCVYAGRPNMYGYHTVNMRYRYLHARTRHLLLPMFPPAAGQHHRLAANSHHIIHSFTKMIKSYLKLKNKF